MSSPAENNPDIPNIPAAFLLIFSIFAGSSAGFEMLNIGAQESNQPIPLD